MRTKWLQNETEMAGKTVKVVASTYNQAAIVFEDGSVIGIAVDGDELDFGVTWEVRHTTSNSWLVPDVFTHEEYQLASKESVNRRDSQERAELARLKAKYESIPPADEIGTEAAELAAKKSTATENDQ